MSDSQSCEFRLQRFPVCEFIGSMFLAIAAVSPIILFIEVLHADIVMAVIADALAVGFVLFALIELFNPICTAFFNPIVTFVMAVEGQIRWKKALNYICAQFLGGLVGVIFTHLMFYDTVSKVIEISSVSRSGGAYLGEVLGTFILVLAILSLAFQQSSRVSLVVGLLVGGMLLATSSTMFANPQIVVARMLTYSAAGVSPFDGVVFIIMEVIGGLFALGVWSRYIKGCQP